MSIDVVLVIVVLTALAFDFTNGFHDTANVVATSISTRALGPHRAIALASVLNFVGAFISLKVADTVGQGFVDTGAVTTTVVFAALTGAIAWNLVTWYIGLPSSSSHAVIGGLVGAVVAATGWGAVNGNGLVTKLIVPALVAPVVAFLAAFISIVLVYRIIAYSRPGTVGRRFRSGQLVSSSLLALSHGTNDAQKTMGIITLALVAAGKISPQHFHVPVWVVIASATAISLGTFSGGWRIIKTLGFRLVRFDAPQGFVAQTAGAAVILAASHGGFPLSTTHVITGGITGAGAGKRLRTVHWGIAREIVIAWCLTLPCAALMAAAAYGILSLFGSGDAGPLTVSAAMLLALAAALLLNLRSANKRRLAMEQR
jgi:PiT family inorganic phosphate transporter